jgi:hypothetical protein
MLASFLMGLMTICWARIRVGIKQVCESLYCTGCWQGHCVSLAMAYEPVRVLDARNMVWRESNLWTWHCNLGVLGGSLDTCYIYWTAWLADVYAEFPLCMFRLHLTCESKVFVTFVFFLWLSVRRRLDRTGQGGGFGCDSVADFSVTERRKYSFDRPKIWQ